MFGLFGNNNNNNWSYEELETPISKEEYLKVGDNAERTILEWIYSDDYTLIRNENNVLLEQKPIIGSKISAAKATGVVSNIEFNRLVDILFTNDVDKRRELYDDLLENEVVKVIDDNNVVINSKFQAPSGIAPREFVALKRRTYFDDGSCMITMYSINNKDNPFNEEYVRGVCRTGILLSPLVGEDGKILDGMINVIKLDHIDPKGWVPSMVINMYAGKVADKIVKMQELYG